MTDPILFTDATARFALPFLRPGQAQKEYFVNQAFAVSDLLHHTAVVGESAVPPISATDGDAWLVGSGASGEWSGHDDEIAGRQAGLWVFLQPVAGMRVYDRTSGQFLLFDDGWHRPSPPATATGGTTIDSELRQSFAGLVAALQTAGIFAVTQ
ncbi:DUF2793 domain-containing protein [Parerythrobacter lacustris]|uniref:DUF2793 domain-containing protein n=1 Tax=Parerythrobacter lacustris TaxID=2969984 RepID=A0ABT1XRI3_9SPHN|nr:DUF2793 domain-containing protein [Parerythrobacter lacustris]MCR2834268.1 DUF2793 domain-containing protein [Parerythrobacter lacustris]